MPDIEESLCHQGGLAAPRNAMNHQGKRFRAGQISPDSFRFVAPPHKMPGTLFGKELVIQVLPVFLGKRDHISHFLPDDSAQIAFHTPTESLQVFRPGFVNGSAPPDPALPARGGPLIKDPNLLPGKLP